MRISNITLIALLITALLFGCNKNEDFAPKAPEPATTEVTTEHKPAGQNGETKNLGTAPAQRMVIKNANLTLENDAPEDTGQKALAIVQAAGGFIVNNTTQAYGESTRVSLTMRIPSSGFEAVVAQLRELGGVRSEAITGEDVTEEFMDLQAQLRNQRALEARFVELLGQAATVAETIEVEQELARVRTEVERLEGRSKFLNDRVALSTIQLEIQPKRTFSSQSTTIGKEVADAFGDAGEIVAVVIGGLIRLAAALLPISVALAMLIFVLKALSRRRKRSQS